MTETSTMRAPLSPQDERVLGALSHISILLPGMGILAPILIWVTQRERSRFVAFQALQAVVFPLALLLLWFLGGACYMGSIFLIMIGGFAMSGRSGMEGPDPLVGGLFVLPFAVFLLMLLVALLMLVYGIAAAILTFQGNDFRYALIGRWVERFERVLAKTSSTGIARWR